MHIEEMNDHREGVSTDDADLRVVVEDDLHVGNAYHRFNYVSAYPQTCEPGVSGSGSEAQ
jgi:hypothetical protein